MYLNQVTDTVVESGYWYCTWIRLLILHLNQVTDTALESGYWYCTWIRLLILYLNQVTDTVLESSYWYCTWIRLLILLVAAFVTTTEWLQYYKIKFSIIAFILLNNRFWSRFEDILFVNYCWDLPTFISTFRHHPERFIKLLYLSWQYVMPDDKLRRSCTVNV